MSAPTSLALLRAPVIHAPIHLRESGPPRREREARIPDFLLNRFPASVRLKPFAVSRGAWRIPCKIFACKSFRGRRKKFVDAICARVPCLPAPIRVVFEARKMLCAIGCCGYGPGSMAVALAMRRPNHSLRALSDSRPGHAARCHTQMTQLHSR